MDNRTLEIVLCADEMNLSLVLPFVCSTAIVIIVYCRTILFLFHFHIATMC